MVFVDGPLPLAAGLYPPDCRMAIAKDLLRSHDIGLAEVAERIGYGSAGTWGNRLVATREHCMASSAKVTA
jgi:transcriptional regulator GlxA family with amidase domain